MARLASSSTKFTDVLSLTTLGIMTLLTDDERHQFLAHEVRELRSTSRHKQLHEPIIWLILKLGEACRERIPICMRRTVNLFMTAIEAYSP
jgi:hypothetical protein